MLELLYEMRYDILSFLIIGIGFTIGTMAAKK
jgi:hypothetical protein